MLQQLAREGRTQLKRTARPPNCRRPARSFGVVLATLGMPHQHISAADVAQHFAGHFAGIGALCMFAEILRRPSRGTRMPGSQAGNERIRRNHRHIRNFGNALARLATSSAANARAVHFQFPATSLRRMDLTDSRNGRAG